MSVLVPPRGTKGGRMPRQLAGILRVFNAIMFRIYKHRQFNNANVLALTTIGAKTGQRRTTTLAYFQDRGSSVLIVGSAGGTITHPAWFFNIAKHPDQVWVQIGDRQLHVRPETLSGEERAATWQRIIQQSPGFAGYEQKTDRELPVIRLTPISD